MEGKSTTACRDDVGAARRHHAAGRVIKYCRAWIACSSRGIVGARGVSNRRGHRDGTSGSLRARRLGTRAAPSPRSSSRHHGLRWFVVSSPPCTPPPTAACRPAGYARPCAVGGVALVRCHRLPSPCVFAGRRNVHRLSHPDKNKDLAFVSWSWRWHACGTDSTHRHRLTLVLGALIVALARFDLFAKRPRAHPARASARRPRANVLAPRRGHAARPAAHRHGS